MPELLNIFFLNLNTHLFRDIIFIFLVLLVSLFIFIVCYTINKRVSEAKKKVWLETIADLINAAIFSTDESPICGELSEKLIALLKIQGFRNYMINALSDAKKNLSGSSAMNIKKLYEELSLDRDSFQKLKNNSWHIKAKGIQELAVMQQAKYVKHIFKLTTHANELVRNEAQCCLLNIYGFPGLRFLDVAEYPVSQWQHIQLLNKLNDVLPNNFDPIKKWLRSSNESVVVFALKLSAFYNCYAVYDDVIKCMENSCMQVKLTALAYLKKIGQEGTSKLILVSYYFQNKIIKLAVLNALIDLGTVADVPFLLRELNDKDDNVKAAAAKALSYLHPSGTTFLQTQQCANQNPWKAIFLQLKNERAA